MKIYLRPIRQPKYSFTSFSMANEVVAPPDIVLPCVQVIGSPFSLVAKYV